jgi:branched-chain amino acid transport system substrate-binding protein
VSEEPAGDDRRVPGYRILRRIGRGGFAVVYEAEQLSLNRSVALKMLNADQATEKDLRRFERERLLASELSRHRHVVDVIDAGTSTDGQPFIVMRLYRRGSLAQALADGGPMTPAEAVSVTDKLASALQAAHNLGVIHRDVKPENVLISDDGEPALTDFGISVLSGPERTTTANFFTMGHAAPEVLEHGEYGVPSDVYALASTAYMMLAGRYAFTGDNQYAQMRAIVEDPVPAIGRPDLPPALEAAIVRGMAKRPEDRFGSVVALAEAMRTALAAPPRPSAAPAFAGYPPGAGTYPPAPGSYPPGPGSYPPAHPPPHQPSHQPSAAATSLLPPPAPSRHPAHQQPSHQPPAPTAAGSAGPGQGRRGRAVLLGIGALTAVAAVVGGTYALDVPPGSLLNGGGAPLVLASDMSLQNVPDGKSPTNVAVQLYLDQVGGKAGSHRVQLRLYDVATPKLPGWEGAACARNAGDHLARTDEVAVIGPYNSGCAKLMLPIIGKDPGSAMAMISNGSTDPGLTKPWLAGEPDKYYPSGQRTFARVVTSDDVQGRAAATFAAGDLKVTKVYVLDDGGVYGTSMARAFADAARGAGITVVGQGRWSRTDSDYTPLFEKVKAAGADAVFLGGAVAANGLRVIQDKVSVLGDNSTVKLLAADGFVGEPKLAALAEAQGMYLTFPGLSPEGVRRRGGPGSEFLDAFQAKYGADPADPYALYGVAATQVLLQAIRQSDGTRAGVLKALFSAPGVTVPASVSVLGAPTSIDPATGDVSIKDVTVEVIKRGSETFETVVTPT